MRPESIGRAAPLCSRKAAAHRSLSTAPALVVAEAAGFVRTGHTRQSDPLIDGTFTDEFTYDLLATDPR